MSLQKQTKDPLFEDILWNQPVNKRAAGKLLIIGGHSQQFQAIHSAYRATQEAGAGTIQLVLPKSLRSMVGNLPEAAFVADTRSGSLSKEALQDILGFAQAADVILLPGDMSANPETVSLLQSLLSQSETPCILTEAVAKLFLATPETLSLAAALIASPSGFSDIAKKLSIPIAIKQPDLGKEQRLLEALGEQLPGVLLAHNDHALVAYEGDISLTPLTHADPTQLAGWTATYYMQHADKFKAVTTAAWQIYTIDS